MPLRLLLWIWIALIAAAATPVSAGTLATGLIHVGTGDFVRCTLVNLGKKTMASADLSVQVRAADGGPPVLNSFSTNCVLDLPPGQGCILDIESAAGQRVYCHFEFKGGAKKMRGAMDVLRATGDVALPAL